MPNCVEWYGKVKEEAEIVSRAFKALYESNEYIDFVARTAEAQINKYAFWIDWVRRRENPKISRK